MRANFPKLESEPHEKPPRTKALNFDEFGGGEREPFPNFQTERHTARKLHYNECSTPWGQESLMIILQQFIPEEFLLESHFPICNLAVNGVLKRHGQNRQDLERKNQPAHPIPDEKSPASGPVFFSLPKQPAADVDL